MFIQNSLHDEVATNAHVALWQVLVIGTGLQDAADLAWWQPVPTTSPQGSPQGRGQAAKKGAQAASKASRSSSGSPHGSPTQGMSPASCSAQRSVTACAALTAHFCASSSPVAMKLPEVGHLASAR